jgi:hypothetical protein
VAHHAFTIGRDVDAPLNIAIGCVHRRRGYEDPAAKKSVVVVMVVVMKEPVMMVVVMVVKSGKLNQWLWLSCLGQIVGD